MITLVEGGFLRCFSISKLDRAPMASTIISSLWKTFVLMLYRRTMKLRLKHATSPVVRPCGQNGREHSAEIPPQYWLSVVSRDTMGVVDAGKSRSRMGCRILAGR